MTLLSVRYVPQVRAVTPPACLPVCMSAACLPVCAMCRRDPQGGGRGQAGAQAGGLSTAADAHPVPAAGQGAEPAGGQGSSRCPGPRGPGGRQQACSGPWQFCWGAGQQCWECCSGQLSRRCSGGEGQQDEQRRGSGEQRWERIRTDCCRSCRFFCWQRNRRSHGWCWSGVQQPGGDACCCHSSNRCRRNTSSSGSRCWKGQEQQRGGLCGQQQWA